jgi:hypothetical protein
VTVINLPLANSGACVARLRRSDPELAGLLAGEELIPVLKPREATGDSVAIAVEPRAGLGLPSGVTPPDTVRFHPTGTLLAQDRVVLDILRLTRWKRPVYLACTVTPDHVPWLWPYARLDGLASRIIPSADPTVHDVDHLRTQLLERVTYAGVTDTTLRLDPDSRALCSNYVAALLQLATAEVKIGRGNEAMATLRFMDQHAPPARLGLDKGPVLEWRANIEALAAKRAGSAAGAE